MGERSRFKLREMLIKDTVRVEMVWTATAYQGPSYVELTSTERISKFQYLKTGQLKLTNT